MSARTSRQLRVPDDVHGVRLQDYLERQWPSVHRKQLRALVRDGAVEVNATVAGGHTRLCTGDSVSVELPAGGLRERTVTASATDSLRVLAEAEFCIVVDKPAGVPSVPDRAGKEMGVYGMLADLRPHEDLRIAHRLDRDTSGCLAIARGIEGARWLDTCFREHRARKTYIALVEGRVARDRIEIRRALGPDRRRPGMVTVVGDGTKRSRAAATDVEVLERFRGHTLLELVPHTGRGHQLRAHLRSIGHPIVADQAYGAVGPLRMSAIKRGYKARPGTLETPLLDRHFLHSASIEIPSPDGSVALCAQAPLPDDLERALAKVRRFSPAVEAR